MNTELFLARRIGSASGGESKGVMIRITFATTAVSIAVMIVAVAVIMGFRSEISGKISAFTGHFRVQALDYGGSSESAPIRLDAAFETNVSSIPGFRSMSPYTLKMGIIKTTEATRGIVLKGVDGAYDLSFFADCLTEGSLPRLSDSIRHKDILISSSVARELMIDVDSRIEILFVNGDRPLRRDRFRVSGLYSSGLGEMDDRFAVTDISNIRRLNGWDDDQITGYEIRVDDMERMEEFAGPLAAAVVPYDKGDPRLMIRSVKGDFPQLFDWLATHDVNAAVIIAIMIVVALVSMISALLIILLEKIRMIGILKTLGMRNSSLRRIFIMRSAGIVISGLIAGGIVGIGIALIQKHSGIMKLDEAGYFLSAVPIELSWWWIAALIIGTLVVILALLVFPTSIIGRITPEKTIRYQ